MNIDNLLLTNGSDCAENYNIIFNHLKDLFFDGYTPFGLCMGIKNIQSAHEYKAVDKLRLYENVHGDLLSHGFCENCYTNYIDMIKENRGLK